MSGYLKFLTWALANIETVKALLARSKRSSAS